MERTRIESRLVSRRGSEALVGMFRSLPETRSHYVVDLAGLELTVYTSLA